MTKFESNPPTGSSLGESWTQPASSQTSEPAIRGWAASRRIVAGAEPSHSEVLVLKSNQVVLKRVLGSTSMLSMRAQQIARTAWLAILVMIGSWRCFAASPADVYVDRVKPLLKHRCYSCHGALRQQAKLRVDTAAALLRGGKSGPALVPGNPGQSLILAKVASESLDERMPPEHEGEPLTAAEIGFVRDWIQAGAPSPEGEEGEVDATKHWAFKPLVRPAVPPRVGSAWVRNPIDSFLAASHAKLGLVPQAEADPEVLRRRLYAGLLGLPSEFEPNVVFALDPDQSEGWYERAVERLLSDPRHGERWGRHWMDVWRYSDWWGLGDQLRNSQKHIWHWRDWIVESLNANLPYDEMIRQMLAADELNPNDLDKLRATGFLARNYFLFNRHQWLDETVEHVGKGLLGLTMNCAKCHDHKYDPISQSDYYGFRAIFEPYHVRLDQVPGEIDFEKAGVPRVFDGAMDVPTYLFIRGNESHPDRTAPVQPKVPGFIGLQMPAPTKVSLPSEAWQPERREWVLRDHLQSARRQLESREPAVSNAWRLHAEQPLDAGSLQQLIVVEAEAYAAAAEVRSVECRSAAMKYDWTTTPLALSSGKRSRDETAKESARLRSLAIQAGREAEVAKARARTARAELRLITEASRRTPALLQELKAANDQLEQARKAASAPIKKEDSYKRLPGARWTPTRFMSSGADDPEVKFVPESSGRRTALARWITDRRNPLLARVAANHLWNRHFGSPLAPVVFDLGRKGQAPVHGELLDWLAAELIDSGWNLKHMHRLLVTSAAYRMSSSNAGREENLRRDPDNAQWWRRNPIRIEAQMVRDALLAHAGTMDWKQGGPPVPTAQQPDSRRRSMYFFHSNNERNLFLSVFDDAKVKECYRRDESIVPQQALALSNSGLTREAASRIAVRWTRELKSAGRDAGVRTFIIHAFQRLLGYSPREGEIRESEAALREWARINPAAEELELRAQLIWVLLNHNDFVTLR